MTLSETMTRLQTWTFYIVTRVTNLTPLTGHIPDQQDVDTLTLVTRHDRVHWPWDDCHFQTVAIMTWQSRHKHSLHSPRCYKRLAVILWEMTKDCLSGFPVKTLLCGLNDNQHLSQIFNYIFFLSIKVNCTPTYMKDITFST